MFFFVQQNFKVINCHYLKSFLWIKQQRFKIFFYFGLKIWKMFNLGFITFKLFLKTCAEIFNVLTLKCVNVINDCFCQNGQCDERFWIFQLFLGDVGQFIECHFPEINLFATFLPNLFLPHFSSITSPNQFETIKGKKVFFPSHTRGKKLFFCARAKWHSIKCPLTV